MDKLESLLAALGIGRALCSPIRAIMRSLFHRRALFSCLFVVVLFFFFSPATSAQEERRPTIRFVRNPDAAPEFKLADLDGKPLTLANSHGKVILLNFWATWCGPCRAEIPDLVELQKKYKDRLQVIGLVVDGEDQNEIKKFVVESGINYPVALATTDIRMQYGGIGALPTSFMLDGEGRVVQKHEGLRNPVLYEVEIRALLGLPIGNVAVQTFEDTGEVFLKHADRASQLPGVDLSKLTTEQRNVALHRFNAEACTCGCKFTLAQCRIYDRGCQISQAATAKIVAEIAGLLEEPAVPDSAPAGPGPVKAVEPTASGLPQPSAAPSPAPPSPPDSHN
jgi:thiol-disulfide isomerase/thioredoxin